jgi:type II secretory ATPase GspE/PulE/Tfp pilus assembly ATPase PilB-like protein/CheY-like chemotaxis protein
MTDPDGSHWLRKVAAHAGLDLELPSRPDIAAVRGAWPVVAEACRLTENDFTQRVASHFRVGVADVWTHDPQAVRLLPESVARRYGVLPLSVSDTSVVVATSDPTSRSAHRELVAHTNRQPVYLMATPSVLTRALDQAYAPSRAARGTLQTLVAQVQESDFTVVTNQGTGVFTSFQLEDPPVVALADAILHEAVRYRATEVHVEPGPERGRLRYRLDGVLQDVLPLPGPVYDRLVARLKHLAEGAGGGERGDGRDLAGGTGSSAAGFRIRPASGVERRGRLLATPTPDGESLTIRLTDPRAIPTLRGLGFDEEERARCARILSRRAGLVLVTGPARSGIGEFVYTALAALRKQKVLSLEGQPERDIPGVTQIRYDAELGRSFAETLQGLLDRDPDVLHAGELRDLATARIALRSAVTGRKVLATVHTPDAVSGVRRLVDLGLDPGRLGESLDAVVSLRRVRALCEACTRPWDPDQDARSREAKLSAALGVRPARRPMGCPTCAGTGYRGQLPLAEILEVSAELRQLLATSPSDADLLRAARAEGMQSFGELALERVAAGRTTVEEVERVLGFVPSREESPGSVGPVLVVDDEEQDRRLVSRFLESAGFRVVEAADGETALGILESGDEDVSLVLLDIYMPGIDGTEVLRRIRRSLATQALPVIVLTGSRNARDELHLLDAGADDYLLKPVEPERLASRAKAVLRRSGVRVTTERREAEEPSGAGALER